MPAPSYQPAPIGGPAPTQLQQCVSGTHMTRVVETVNLTQQGKLNATLDVVTLVPDNVETTVIDARISAFSFIGFQPLTASAALEYASGSVYVSEQKAGELTIVHTDDPDDMRSFRLLIIG